MPKPKTEEKLPYTLVPDRNGDERNFSVKVDYVCIGEVSKSFGEPEYWYVSRFEPNEFKDNGRHEKFPTKELAADFLYRVRTAAFKIADRNPLPEVVRKYMEDRALRLREWYNKCTGELIQIQSEQWALAKMARQYNLSSVEYHTECSDRDKAIQSLMEFEFSIPNPDYDPKAKAPAEGKSPKVGEHGLATHEKYITGNMVDIAYAFGGKDEGRSLKSRLKSVLEFVSNSDVSELDL